MLIKVEMVGGVEKREFRNKTTGDLMSFRDQTGYVFLNGGKYPEKASFSLGEEGPPYDEGEYWLSAGSFQIGRYGNLELKRQAVLVPVSKQPEYINLQTGEVLDKASVSAKIRAA